MRFFDRKYSLQIGDYQSGDGISIDNLQVRFRVRKSVNNKTKIDRCSVSVYNLSKESIAFLETDYPVAILSVGYRGDVVRLFYGEVVSVETTKNGTDRITKLSITPAYSELTYKIMSEIVPENGSVEDAIEVIRKQTSLAKGVYKGNRLSTKIIYGYPLSGTPKEMLNQVCDAYNLQWKIEGQALYINDSDSVEVSSRELAPVISPQTGLIDVPYYFTGVSKKSSKDDTKKAGVRFTALINPNVVPGGIVRVDYQGNSEYFRVEEMEFTGDFRGNSWNMTCVCSKQPEGV